jgi:hypothetical protein
MNSKRLTVLVSVLCFLTLAACAKPQAEIIPRESYEQQLVDASATAVRDMRQFSRPRTFDYALQWAQGVLIFPSFKKHHWLSRVEGRDGILLIRDASGAWSQPAFYNINNDGNGPHPAMEAGMLIYVFFDRDLMLNGLSSGYRLPEDIGMIVSHGNGQAEEYNLEENLSVLLFLDQPGTPMDGSFLTGWISARPTPNEAYYGTDPVAPATLDTPATPENIMINKYFVSRPVQQVWDALNNVAPMNGDMEGTKVEDASRESRETTMHRQADAESAS